MDWRKLPNLVHGICTYHRQWLPGSERGWRSRKHKRHSSGDYRTPPPPHEHAGLRRHVLNTLTGPAVNIERHERALLGSAFLLKLHKLNCETLILACGMTHLHVLYQSRAHDAMDELGKAKQYSSYRMRHRPGKVWAAGGKIVRIEGPAHAQNTFEYLNGHAEKEGAWVWRFDRDVMPTREVLDALYERLVHSMGGEAGSDER